MRTKAIEFIKSFTINDRSNKRAMNVLLGHTVGRVSRAWQTYLDLLQRYPCRAHAANTCILMATGDVIAQVALEWRPLRNYDVKRTARFALVGAVLAGSGMHVWYRALDRWVRCSNVSAGALIKTVADQAFFLPVYLGVFVGVMGVLRGDRLDKVRHKLARDFRPMLVASYGLWPAVQLFNFYVLPLQHRILLINVVSLFWNSYIGWKAERTIHPHTEEDQLSI